MNTAAETRPDDEGSIVRLDGRLAIQVADLLSLLAEAPSTPGALRDEVEERAEEIGFAIPALPHQWQPGQRRTPDPAELDTATATGIAGMLELLAELPSTPPHVADDARQHAEAIWELLGAGDASPTDHS